MSSTPGGLRTSGTTRVGVTTHADEELMEMVGRNPTDVVAIVFVVGMDGKPVYLR